MVDSPRLSERPLMSQRLKLIVWTLALAPFVLIARRGLDEGPGIQAGDYAQYLCNQRIY